MKLLIMNVCGQCGVRKTRSHQACSACSAPPGGPEAVAPERPDGTCWSRLSGRFLCRSCGFWAPINSIDADGGVLCAFCGTDQAFPPSRWTDVLQKAHEVADIDGPSASARASFAEAADIPRPETWGDIQRRWRDKPTEEELKTEWTCEAGHPLSSCCGALVDVRAGSSKAATICTSCGTETAYLPAAGAASVYPDLVVALADEHQAGPKLANASTNRSGAAAIECPVCHAPLSVTGAAVETCGHCEASVSVPKKAQAAAGDAESKPLWLLFRGPSTLRKEAIRRAQAQHQSPLAPPGQMSPPAPRSASGKVALLALVALLVVAGGAVLALWALQPEAQTEQTLAFGQTRGANVTNTAQDYRFSVDVPESAAIMVASDFSVCAELYSITSNDDGEVSTPVATEHTNGPGNLELETRLEPGTYRLRVRPFRPQTEPSGSFSVTLSRAEPFVQETIPPREVPAPPRLPTVKLGEVITDFVSPDRTAVSYALSGLDAGEYSIWVRPDDPTKATLQLEVGQNAAVQARGKMEATKGGAVVRLSTKLSTGTEVLSIKGSGMTGDAFFDIVVAPLFEVEELPQNLINAYRSQLCTGLEQCYREHNALGVVAISATGFLGTDGTMSKVKVRSGPPAKVRRCIRDQLKNRRIEGYFGPKARILCECAGTLLSGTRMISTTATFEPM